MANEKYYPVLTRKDSVVKRYGTMTGNGTSNPVLPSGKWGQLITGATRSAPGVYALVLDKKYPQLLQPDMEIVNGTTANLHAEITAIDVTAGTATLKTYVNTTPTDMGVADVLYLELTVRNSGRNSST